MSKSQLFAALFFPGLPLITIDGVTGVLKAVERTSPESDKDFIVTLEVTQQTGDYDNPHRAETIERRINVHTTD